MKIMNDTEQKTIIFEEIKIGEVFEWDSNFYLKISKTTAFDVYNNLLEDFGGSECLIPRKSELRIF